MQQEEVVGRARELRRDKDDGRGGGAQQCHVHHGNANVEGALRGAGNAQGEDKGNNDNAVRDHCQREPTHNGRDRGGGNMTRDNGGQ
jgi:hypothetical protein